MPTYEFRFAVAAGGQGIVRTETVPSAFGETAAAVEAGIRTARFLAAEDLDSDGVAVHMVVVREHPDMLPSRSSGWREWPSLDDLDRARRELAAAMAGAGDAGELAAERLMGTVAAYVALEKETRRLDEDAEKDWRAAAEWLDWDNAVTAARGVVPQPAAILLLARARRSGRAPFPGGAVVCSGSRFTFRYDDKGKEIT